MNLSIQVVDCTFGIAAQGVRVGLSGNVSSGWHAVAVGQTDSNGSLTEWHDGALPPGTYRLEVDLDGYYADLGVVPFNPRAIVEFRVLDGTADLLIPFLITGSSHMVYRSAPPP